MKASLLINNNTREILKAIGKKGETYDQIIRELIEKKNRLDSIESKSARNTFTGIESAKGDNFYA